MHLNQVFLGDLNYRVHNCGSPEDALRLVSEAARASSKAAGGRLVQRTLSGEEASSIDRASADSVKEEEDVEDGGEAAALRTWLELRYGGLSLGAAKNPGPAKAWQQLLGRGREELRAAMAQGRVLHGFSEGPIGFPPSYRRVKGLGCGDYTDERLLRQAYSTRIATGWGGPRQRRVALASYQLSF